MNSYQRVMAALELKQPDRVPIIEFIIDPKIYQVLLPGAKSQTDFEEHFGFDAVCCGVKFNKVKENQNGSYYDEWEVFYKPCQELIDHPVKGPIEKLEDLKNYNPPDPDLPHRLGKLPELVEKFKKKKAIILHQRAAFMWSAYLVGLENLLAYFLIKPEFAHELLDKVLEVNIKIARNAIRAGADIIVLGDDYAGNDALLFSPAIFEEFILPRFQRIVDAIHNEGGKVIKHSDGNLLEILDDIVNTGVDGLNPIEPVAGMDIGEVKKRCGRRICLLGNIDCGELLPHGSEESVRRAVKECISKAAPNGGFILTSSNSIHSSVKPENYLSMIKAARDYGHYPIG